MRLEITDIDRNFLAGSRVERPDAAWMNMLDTPIRLHGLASAAPGKLWRLPEPVISRISDGVTTLARHTAGGRVRFRTDSPYIAFRGRLAFTGSMPHMPLTGSAGVELFVDGRSAAVFRPVNDQAEWLEGMAELPDGMHDIDLALPLYNGLTEGH
ncbi:MAG: hypothetical protein IKK21_05685, partial [Clostridia bacterium]|nr:hypothetical protein [Clostridia bacterium]